MARIGRGTLRALIILGLIVAGLLLFVLGGIAALLLADAWA